MVRFWLYAHCCRVVLLSQDCQVTGVPEVTAAASMHRSGTVPLGPRRISPPLILATVVWNWYVAVNVRRERPVTDGYCSTALSFAYEGIVVGRPGSTASLVS